nr:Protein of uncharacterised function (DUF3037) [Raoultella sp. NCTC 9187]
MNTYKYSIIRITPSPVRAETINVGLVVMKPSGPDVRVLENPTKLKAITNTFGLEALENSQKQLENILTSGLNIEQASLFFQGSFALSSVGTFHAANEREYELKINELNKLFITPERARKRTEVSQKELLPSLRTGLRKRALWVRTSTTLAIIKWCRGIPFLNLKASTLNFY